MRMTALAGAVLALPAALLAQDMERYDLRGEHVAIYNLAGTTVIEAGNGPAVGVALRRGGPDASQLRVETGPVDGRETLRVLYPASSIRYEPVREHGYSTTIRVRDDGTFSDNDWTRGDRERGRRVRLDRRRGGLEAHADLTITVPRGQRLSVYIGAGDVTVTNVDGTLRVDGHANHMTARGIRGSHVLDLGSGQVEVTDAQGDLEVDTGSGGVTVRGMRGDALEVDTGSGSVDLADVSVLDLNIDTGSGSVRVDRGSAERVNIDTGSGSVRATLGGALRDIIVDTGSGGVTLTLPGDYGAMVQLETGSGGIEVDFPLEVRRFQRDEISGTIGNGSGRLEVDTGSGRIAIRRG